LIAEPVRVDDALSSFRHFMRALQVERARRGADPWSDCPMTMPQLRALSLIAADHEGLSSRALAVRLGVGASAVTPLVDRLVEHGVVRRHEDPHDRRIARLYATESGNAALDRMLAGQGDLLRDALSALSSDQLAQVTSAFDVLRAALGDIQSTATQGNEA